MDIIKFILQRKMCIYLKSNAKTEKQKMFLSSHTTSPLTNGHMLTEQDKKVITTLQALPCDYWDFKNHDVREYTHGIHNYPAMMVCPISRNILHIMKEIQPIHTLFDPFSGSGTVLVEGILANVETVYGTDINPLALFLSKVKTTKLNPQTLQKEFSHLQKEIDRIYQNHASQINNVDSVMYHTYGLDLTAKKGWGDTAPLYLSQYAEENQLDIEIPNFKNIGYWFKPRVILLLSIIKSQICKVENQDIRNFFFVAFSETIRFVSNRRNGEFKMFRMQPEKVLNFEPNVILEFTTILRRNIEKMTSFVETCTRIPSQTQTFIFNNNATTLKDIPNDCVDLVITSPPYGDSRTTVAYGEYSRLSLQWLDIFDLQEKEIMGIDKSLMGGNKIKDGFLCTIPSTTLVNSLANIQKVDLERAGDVYSFYLDLEKAICSISAKTKQGGYHFWVVGNRTVKGELLLTHQIIAEIAEHYGLVHVHTVQRTIVNKVMPSLNSPTNETGKKSSTMTNEHIVILRKTGR